MQKDLMAPLYTHRKVLGVIGICHGPAVPDIKSAYESFGKSCRWMLTACACCVTLKLRARQALLASSSVR